MLKMVGCTYIQMQYGRCNHFKNFHKCEGVSESMCSMSAVCHIAQESMYCNNYELDCILCCVLYIPVIWFAIIKIWFVVIENVAHLFDNKYFTNLFAISNHFLSSLPCLAPIVACSFL